MSVDEIIKGLLINYPNSTFVRASVAKLRAAEELNRLFVNAFDFAHTDNGYTIFREADIDAATDASSAYENAGGEG